MEVVSRISILKDKIIKLRTKRQQGNSIATVGLVPTMGYLHQGHASLIKAARAQCDITVVSIFVNPMQFGPNEDYDRYPRDTDRDIQLAAAEAVDLLFLPTVEEIYPHYPLHTKVTVADITTKLCGASRPGHFDGVTTVVLKLFHIVSPHRAYFGMKDAQQIAVIQTMIEELNLDIELIPCPTLREADGLAMSSRNVNLNAEERAQAVVLSQALSRLDDWVQEAGMTFERLREKLEQHILSVPLASIDYVEVISYPLLQAIKAGTRLNEYPEQQSFIAALAVYFGHTRLIDNRIMKLQEVNPDV